MLNVVYICGCEERVVDLGDSFFECLHCDRFCDIEQCELCARLEESDVEAYLKSIEEQDEEDE